MVYLSEWMASDSMALLGITIKEIRCLAGVEKEAQVGYCCSGDHRVMIKPNPSSHCPQVP